MNSCQEKMHVKRRPKTRRPGFSFLFSMDNACGWFFCLDSCSWPVTFVLLFFLAIIWQFSFTIFAGKMLYNIFRPSRIILVIAMFSHFPRPLCPSPMKIFTYAQVLNTQLKGFSKLIGFNYSGSRAETKAKSRILPDDRSPLDLDPDLSLDQSPEYLAAASALRDFTDHWRRVNWLERFFKIFEMDTGSMLWKIFGLWLFLGKIFIYLS